MPRLALAALAVALLSACQRREPVEFARARSTEAFLIQQIADLRALNARAESGQLVTQDRVAIGVAEETAKALLDASLPQEHVLGKRVRVRIESAQPIFRGNSAALVFKASARGVRVTSAVAHLELAGRLGNFRIGEGRLSAAVELAHFKVLDASLGDLAADALEGLVRNNLASLSSLMPGLELPVHLEQSITIGGLDEGVVVAKGGTLPLQMTLAEVLPVNQRLWVLLDVKAGPWQTVAAAEKTLTADGKPAAEKKASTGEKPAAEKSPPAEKKP